MLQRRQALRILAIATVALAGAAASATLVLAAQHLWECNWCHQQYQGDNPPRFTKCPAKDMKQTHFWIKKN
jgi:hypothetical protein